MKRIISILVLAMFIFSITSTVFAADSSTTGGSMPDPPITKEAALELATDIAKVTDNLRLTGVSYRYEETGNQVWAFNWESQVSNKYRSISVEINAVSGNLRNYYSYSPDNYEGTPRLTLEEAKVVAEEFAKKMNPVEFEQVRLEPPVVPNIVIPSDEVSKKISPAPSDLSFEYNFRYTRIAKGYSYMNNGINVNVNAVNGNVTGYNCNWDIGEIPTFENVISLQEAGKIFNEKIGLELGHLRIQNNEPRIKAQEENVILAYYPKIVTPAWIDAVTGEIVDFNSNVVVIPKNSNEPISDKPLLAPASRIDSMEDAMKVAKKWVSVPSGYRLIGANYFENPQGTFPANWSFHWSGEAPSYGYISIGINADNGEIINIETSNAQNSVPDKRITTEQAHEIAKDFLRQAVPTKVNQFRVDVLNQAGEMYYLSKADIRSPYYGFRFSRLVDGIPFNDNGANVTVNGEGKVTSYWSNWEELKFPVSEGIITMNEAEEIFSRNLGLELGYVQLKDTDGWKIRLVYRIKSGSEYYIDAKSGELKNRWDGNIYYEKTRVGFNDIKGHWAEQSIARLGELKLIDTEKESFKPDSVMSRGEVITLMAKVLGLTPYVSEEPTFSDVPKDAEDYGYVEAAYKAGLIKGYDGKFEPNSGITREALAVILAQGFKDLEAKEPASFDQFKDAAKISDWAKAAVSDSVKLGLFKADDKGNFNPQQNITKAEAAAIFTQVL